MRKITDLEIAKIDELKNPERRHKLFDFRNQIEFVTENIDFFHDFLYNLYLIKKDTDDEIARNPLGYLKEKYGIEIMGFGNDTELSKFLVAQFLINIYPDYLLKLSSARQIKLYSKKFVDIPKNPDGTMDFVNYRWVKVKPKDISTWPKDYPTAHTQPVANKSRAKFPSMKYYDRIELWPLDGYTSHPIAAVVYLLYCLLHEFGHTIWHSVWSAKEDIETVIEFGGKKFPLAELCDWWVKICEEEIYPVSWYSGYYAPDILDYILNKGNEKLFYAGVSEEFAECFAWFIMKKTMNPWREIQEFSQMDLGNGVPSAKYLFMDLLWNGQEVV